jgi:hypothetical protein
MAFNFDEAREIVEAAKKRGLIRSEGEAPFEPLKEAAGGDLLPDWLQAGISMPPTPPSDKLMDYGR